MKKSDLHRYKWTHEPYLVYIDHEAKELLYLNRSYKFLGCLNDHQLVTYPINTEKVVTVYFYKGGPTTGKERETYVDKILVFRDKYHDYKVLEGGQGVV